MFSEMKGDLFLPKPRFQKDIVFPPLKINQSTFSFIS